MHHNEQHTADTEKKKYAIWILKIFVWDGLTCTGLPSALETPRLAQ